VALHQAPLAEDGGTGPMKALDRYLIRMVLAPTVGGTLLALLVYSAFALASLMRDSTLASAPLATMAMLVGVRDLIALEIILPSAFYLSTIMAFGAWHRDREAYACYANGVSPLRVEAPLIALALVVAALVAVVSLHARPWSYKLSYSLQEQITQLTSELLQPGTFYRWNDQLVIHAQRVHEMEPRLEGVFAAQREGESFRIIRSQRARISPPDAENRQLLEFLDGDIHELSTEDGSRRQTSFERLVYQTQPTESRRAMHRRTLPFDQLMQSASPKDRAEAQWRASIPIITFLIGLMAIRLGHVRPLQSTYARLGIGIALYVLIFNGVNLLSSAVEQGQIPEWPGLYAIIPVLLIVYAAMTRMPALTLRPRP
jgi:lipopolysaccharide export system permease protein